MDSAPVGDLSVFRGFLDSLELDGEVDLISPTERMGRKAGGGGSDASGAMALKSHSEAERRRRERINSHLARLRSIVPSCEKLDKAALLGEVITHVKELSSNAAEAGKGFFIPTDIDEVKVESEMGEFGDDNSSSIIKASLCCEDRPEIISDVRQTLQNMHLKILRAEMATMSSRMKITLLLACHGSSSDKEQNLLKTCVHEALMAVLERSSTARDFSPRTSYSNKRQRASSILQSSVSSSS